ncbi:isoaspartyl peptidase/L-asparaginase family protein [Sphingomonas sp. 3P27F8]|uniref:isoaspartyl peptidase/L-asparaginase family protein n=1 Tax=Sphingomonas sp. 3P27F8 TaxID=2502213 RepID=UPI0010F9FAA6|nr:isoaspartyl peptidase/L-asparaginase family protein [Sphingomonas sp. 3P27F8]
MNEAGWAIIVHGGARTIPTERHGANRDGCRAAAAAGVDLLRDGASALDAVELAVRSLEDDVAFNAGRGAVPTAAGHVELDAAIMDGSTLDIGAVAALQDIANPVLVARMLLGEPAVLLVGEGARAFAVERGIAVTDVFAVHAPGGCADHDTVGAVAIDRQGRIAVATSTGGLPGQIPGRVGDAPIPGCGFYADDHAGGVAISGDGEKILRVTLASRVIEQLYRHPAQSAVTTALGALARVGGEAGLIALDVEGRFGVAHNSDHFAVAMAADWLPEPIAGIHRDEFKDIIHG